MTIYAGEVTDIDADGLVEFTVRGGIRNGEKWSERARPWYPAGTTLPPVVGDLVWIEFRIGAESGSVPLAEPYHRGTITPGTEIVIDSSRNVVLRQGTLGVARLTDDVDKSASLEFYNVALKALLNQLVTEVGSLGGTITAAVPSIPTHIGDISSASETVLAGD